MVVDYRGQILSEFNESIEGFAAATIDIKRLREYRASVKILGLPTLRTEYFRIEKYIQVDECLSEG